MVSTAAMRDTRSIKTKFIAAISINICKMSLFVSSEEQAAAAAAAARRFMSFLSNDQ